MKKKMDKKKYACRLWRESLPANHDSRISKGKGAKLFPSYNDNSIENDNASPEFYVPSQLSNPNRFHYLQVPVSLGLRDVFSNGKWMYPMRYCTQENEPIESYNPRQSSILFFIILQNQYGAKGNPRVNETILIF